MLDELMGRVAIVTGAARGLGRSIAIALAKAGGNLMLVDMRQSDLLTLASELHSLGQRSLAVETDISDEGQVVSMVQRALGEFGSVDILVNNAGINRPASITELTTGDWDAVLDVNLKGAFLCSRAVFPKMIEQEGGHIVNIASIMGKRGWGGHTAYCASKFGLMGLTQALVAEGKPHNIKVTAICPGGMDTSWYDDRPKFDRSVLMDPEIVANLVLFVVSQPKDSLVYEAVVASVSQTNWP